jgi:hypothetical protein
MKFKVTKKEDSREVLYVKISSDNKTYLTELADAYEISLSDLMDQIIEHVKEHGPA